jgi:16S rRNA A1518/A1519 N6-dimethyltransferase RsmA/KsgA/DIM1 with predicted DNA glycosylase/AP lyase activity
MQEPLLVLAVVHEEVPASRFIMLCGASQVKKAFGERRKMLRNTLQPLYTTQQVRGRGGGRALMRVCPSGLRSAAYRWCQAGCMAGYSSSNSSGLLKWCACAVLCHGLQVEEGLAAIGVRPDARAQELSPAQFAALYTQLQKALLSQLEV